MKTISNLFTIIILACAPAVAQAQTWHAVQGDILRIELARAKTPIEIKAFGKSWPWKRLSDGRIRAWIGVDLAAHPGAHRLSLKSGKKAIEGTILVEKGTFRISRITVSKKMAVFDAKTLKRIRADQAAIRAAYRARVNASPAIAISRRPVEGIVSTPFGAQRFVNGEPRSPHSGLDIAAPAGTPIINPLPGRVLLAESMYLNGNTIVIGHGNGLVMVYSHMQELIHHKGEWLKAGEQIGRIGMTGRATGPHLHWGVRFNDARVDPRALLASR